MSASGIGVADPVWKLRLPIVRTTERRPDASCLLVDSLAELDLIDRVLRENELTFDRTRLFGHSGDADVRPSTAGGSATQVQERAASRYSCERGGEKAR